MAAPKLKHELGLLHEKPLRLVEIDNAPDAVPIPELEVAGRTELGNRHRLEDGSEQRYIYTFSDGGQGYDPQYEVRLYEPSGHRKRHRRGLISTVPWLTGLDGDHEGVNETAIANGMVSVAVSREIAGIKRSVQQIGHTSLSREARVQLLVQQDVAKDLGLFKPDEIVGTGYSLAAIVLNGVAAQAKVHGTRLVHGEALDPGPAHRLGPKELRPDKLVESALREFAEIWRIIQRAPKEERERLKQTFPISIDNIIQNFDFFIALALTGESAKMAEDVPKDTSLNVTYFKHFPFNQIAAYRDIFKSHPNVRFSQEEGCHFSGADPRWRKLMIGRTALVQRELDKGVEPEEIDHIAIDESVKKKLERNRSLRRL
jgi:hypothetical protein